MVVVGVGFSFAFEWLSHQYCVMLLLRIELLAVVCASDGGEDKANSSFPMRLAAKAGHA